MQGVGYVLHAHSHFIKRKFVTGKRWLEELINYSLNIVLYVTEICERDTRWRAARTPNYAVYTMQHVRNMLRCTRFMLRVYHTLCITCSPTSYVQYFVTLLLHRVWGNVTDVWFNTLQKIGCICCTDNGNSLGVVLHQSNFFGSAFIYMIERTLQLYPCKLHKTHMHWRGETSPGPGLYCADNSRALATGWPQNRQTPNPPPPRPRVRWLWVALRRLDDYIWNPSDPGLFCLLNLWSAVDQLFSCGCQKTQINKGAKAIQIKTEERRHQPFYKPLNKMSTKYIDQILLSCNIWFDIMMGKQLEKNNNHLT